MKYLGPVSGTTSFVNKTYVDTAYRGFMPAVTGAWLHPSHYLNSATGTPATGNLHFVPFDVGPNSLAITNIGCRVTTVQSGGTVTLRMGLYQDNGTGGAPLLTTAGLLGQGTFIATGSIGSRSVALSLTLAPGRYWGAFLYSVSSAPTTAPVFTCITNASPGLWVANGGNIGDSYRSLLVSGQSTLPTTAQTITSSTLGTCPVLALQAA